MPITTGQSEDCSPIWRSCHCAAENNHRPLNSTIARLFRRNVCFCPKADITTIPRLAQEAEDCSDRCLIEIIQKKIKKEPLVGSGPFDLLIIIRVS
jgi:hypothetical protein